MTAPDFRFWTRAELEHAVREADRQRAAVLALHAPFIAPGVSNACRVCRCSCCDEPEPYPCDTARALGVPTPTPTTSREDS